MGVLSFIEHGSAIQTTIFGHMGLSEMYPWSILARGYLYGVDTPLGEFIMKPNR